jgi:hypothetical protein
VSTAQEIEDAIRSLSAAAREKLPQLFPEFGGDAEWGRIVQDGRPRLELTQLLNRYESDLTQEPMVS